MREQTDSHSFGEATDSYDSKKDQPAKKRLIYKEKNVPNMAQQSDKAATKLTKEERAKIQKQKNRQAAQRSRDMHKQYVTSLQKELLQIKKQLQRSKRYCHRCQQQLDHDNSPLFYSTESTVHLHSDLSCPLEEQPSLSAQINQVPPKEYTEPQSFLRWLQPQEQLPFMKLMLFVCMVVIAIMVIPNEVPVASPPATRALFQNYGQTFGEQAAMVNPVEGWAMQGGLVQLNRGIKDQTCLNSLMKVEGPPMVRKSLRTIHQISYTEQMESIMLCSLRSPETYQIKAELADSPIVRLFVLGSQIKDLMERSGSLLRLSDRNIQLNGIYRLTAEIKSVDLVSHHNCLV